MCPVPEDLDVSVKVSSLSKSQWEEKNMLLLLLFFCFFPCFRGDEDSGVLDWGDFGFW